MSSIFILIFREVEVLEIVYIFIFNGDFSLFICDYNNA